MSRFLSVLLTISLVVSLNVPMNAFATETVTDTETLNSQDVNQEGIESPGDPEVPSVASVEETSEGGETETETNSTGDSSNDVTEAAANVIDLSAGSYTIEEDGDYTVNAYTGANTLTIKADANVTLDDVNITAGDGVSAISIESGNVTLNVAADSTLAGGKGGAGVYVAEGAAVTIEGGKLTAIGNGGTDTTDSGAAGIGGTYANGNSGAITIDGATVVAKGFGVHGSGIGSGSGKVVGEIKIINGANVTAQGGSSSAAIGTSRAGDTGVSAKIAISGEQTVIKATGGAYGAGIGGGYNADSLGNGAETSALPEIAITISGGAINATGGEGGAGIGGGYKTDNVNIDITGGVVTASAGALVSGKTVEKGGEACAIGSGANGSGVFENSPAVEISDAATVNATTLYGGKAAIEGLTDAAANAETNVSVTVEGAPAAKVGDTVYTDIDTAIENWTAGTTLTLLSDVTLSDVITLKSTEHHILNLGTYTMTAAEGKNAIVIQACGTGDSERNAITINADATNPGGINAGSKSVVYYKYADGGITTNDRPIIKINGGVFTGSTSSWGTAGIYTIGTAARKCATLNIAGGTFNCSINGSGKSKLWISGGTFNYSVGSQGDSTAYRLISGGKFKSFGFMTADSNNTKFWIGTSMANSNVGVYVDDNGYLVVGGSAITEAGERFEASSANYDGWSSYLKYSSAADNGLYYTSAAEALSDNNKTTGSVTVYIDSLDLASLNYKGTIVMPADQKALTVTYAEGTTPAWTVKDSSGVEPVYVDDVSNGVVTRTYYTNAVAQIGNTTYESLEEAFAAANAVEDGATVTLLKDVTLGEKLTISGNVTISGDKTITRADDYTGTLFAVNADATLTLDGGLVVDGGNNYAFDKELYATDLANWETAVPSSESTKWFTPEEGAPVATAYMITTSGVVNLNDVSVENHYSTNGSGIVSASKGANVTLNGAKVTHCASTSGSGLVVNASAGVWSRENELITVTMNEGTVIDGNHVGGNHGIFKIYMGTYFTMNGGEVKNTTGWNSNGTAVGIYNAVFTMNGGTICSNSSVYGPNNGRNAAIYGHSNHLFTMNGGTICHNTGRSKAGVDSPYSETGYTGQTIINGGTIIDNTVTGPWNEPDVSGGATLTINYGTFTQDVKKYLAPDTGLVYDEEAKTYGLTKDLYEYNGKAYNTLNEVVEAIQGNGVATASTDAPVVKVLADHKVDDPAVITTDITLDLNGKTITGAKKDGVKVYPVIRVQNSANVTVKNGTINNDDYVFVLGASDGSSAGNLTIESGKYVGETTVASVTKGALTINGGEFSVTEPEGGSDSTYLLNCIDANYRDGSAKVVVKGGTFHKFDPANNAAEGAETNFVAEGYLSETADEGATYTVRVNKDTLEPVVTITFDDSNSGKQMTLKYPSERYDSIQKLIGTNDYNDFVLGASQSELLAYVADGRASNIVITLHEDIELDAPINFYNKYFAMPVEYAVTLDGNGHSIKWAEDYAGTLFNVESGVTLNTKNVTIDGDNAFTFYNDTTTVEDGQNWYTRFVNVGEEDKAVNANVFVNAGNLKLGEGTVIKNVTVASTSDNGKTANTAEGGYYLMYNDDLALIYSEGGKVNIEDAKISGNAGMVLNAVKAETVVKNATIDGNMGAGNKGGVIIANGGSMSIDGSTSIINNKAMARSATILGVINGAEVEFAGTMENNKQLGVGSNTAGAMVVLEGASQFVMNGGSISNNAGGRAGAVASRWVGGNYGQHEETSIVLNSGTISGNTASNDSWNGAAVFLRSPATIGEGMTIDGDIVVNASPAELTITGGTHKGVLTVNNGLTATITGGTFNYDPSAWIAPNHGYIYDEEAKTYTVTSKVAEVNGELYDSIAEAAKAAKAGDIVKVRASHEVTDTVVIEKNVTIDLNGKTVSAVDTLTSKPVFRVLADVTVTNGTVDGTTGFNSYAFIVGNNDTAGTLNVDDGTYKGITSVISVTNGTANISGGEFMTDHDGEGTDYGAQYLLNCMDAAYKNGTAKYNVTGGTFHGFDPADNAAEGAGTNFVSKGYKSTDNEDGTWSVAANMIYGMHFVDPATDEPAWISPMSGNDLAEIVKNGKAFYADYYEMTLEVLESDYVDETVVIDYPMTIDLNGNTISAGKSLEGAPVFRVLSDVTVTNGTVDGTTGTNSYAFIVGNSTTKGTLDIADGTYKGDTSAISVTKGELNIKGGTFEATEYEGAHEFTINCIDSAYAADEARVNISGGSFYKFNPENNAAEGKETDFTVFGYSSYANGDYYDVKLGDLVIHNEEELYAFAELANEGNNFDGLKVTLAADINLGGKTWTPIKSFAGEFDGGDYTISNFHIDATAGSAGFFKTIEAGSGERVHDLTLSDITATVGAYRFGAVANSIKGIVNRVNVENLTVTTTHTNAWVGGFCAFMSWPWINDCTVENMTVNAEAGADLIAGFSPILQKNSNMVFDNNDVKGFKVTVVDTDASGCGVAGFVTQTQRGWEYPKITNSDITGIDITASGNVDVAGFIAWPGAHTTAENCTTEGKIDATGVTSDSCFAGGFFGNLGWNADLGQMGHKISDCTANVDITTKTAPAGGFVGSATNSNNYSMYATFNNCVASGDITCIEGGNAPVGGFAGDADRGVYNNCSATGDVTGTEGKAGGFIGVIEDTNPKYDGRYPVGTRDYKVDVITFANCTAAEEPFVGFVPEAKIAANEVVNESTYVARVNDALYASFDTALADAKESGKTLEILAPVVLSKDATIDMGEVTVNALEGVFPAFRITNGANVTVKGGNVTAEDYVFVLGASDSSSAGNLTIESGTYAGVTSVASVTKGNLVVKGGEFSATDDEYGSTYLLNCIDAAYKNGDATISVQGGTFHGFDPADNASEGKGTNYLPEGFRSSANVDAGTYTVVEDALVATLTFNVDGEQRTEYYYGKPQAGEWESLQHMIGTNDFADFVLGSDVQPLLAYAADGKVSDVVLTLNQDIEEPLELFDRYYQIEDLDYSITIDLNGHTWNCSEGDAVSTHVDATIKNGTIENTANGGCVAIAEDEIDVKMIGVTLKAAEGEQALINMNDKQHVSVLVDATSVLVCDGKVLAGFNKSQTVIVPDTDEVKVALTKQDLDLIAPTVELNDPFADGTAQVAICECVAVNVTDGNKHYATADAALKAAKGGEVVKMIKDSSEDVSVHMVPAGVTFDLNGCYLNANNFLSFGDVIDTATEVGGLVVSNKTEEAIVQLQQGNDMMPIYDTAKGCYSFFEYTLVNRGIKVDEKNTDQVVLGYSFTFDNPAAYALLQAGNSGVKLVGNVTWSAVENYFEYNFTDTCIVRYAEKAASQVGTEKEGRAAITLTLTGLSKFSDELTISSYPTLKSETGVCMSADVAKFSSLDSE